MLNSNSFSSLESSQTSGHTKHVIGVVTFMLHLTTGVLEKATYVTVQDDSLSMRIMSISAVKMTIAVYMQVNKAERIVNQEDYQHKTLFGDGFLKSSIFKLSK